MLLFSHHYSCWLLQYCQVFLKRRQQASLPFIFRIYYSKAGMEQKGTCLFTILTIPIIVYLANHEKINSIMIN